MASEMCSEQNIINMTTSEINKLYTIYATPSESQRLNTDADFTANKLKETLMIEEIFKEKPKSDDEEIAECSPTEDASESLWPYKVIVLLLQEYKTRLNDLNSGQLSRKKFWILITNKLVEQGFKVTSRQCRYKFSELKKTFNSMQELYKNFSNSEKRKFWPHFTIMEQIFESKEKISANGKRKRSPSESSDCIKDTESGESYPTFKWPHEAIILLLEEYQSKQYDFIKGKAPHKKIWDSIAHNLNMLGYDVTTEQCQSKFSGLKKGYKSMREQFLNFGISAKNWPYYSYMEEFIETNPLIESPKKKSQPKVTNHNSSNSKSIIMKGSPKTEKQKTISIMSKILNDMREDREKRRQEAERRHRENFNQREEMLNSFKELINILKNK